MATITYTIIKGAAPFTVELSPISATTHTAIGTYSFTDVPNGQYTLIVTDSNDCGYEKILNIDPLATTTTTTTAPPDEAIIVGNTQEETFIFNENQTNRSSHYTTNDEDVATLYLWLKTTSGEPLTNEINIGYNFTSTGSTFTIDSLSNSLNAELNEITIGPADDIAGQIKLKPNFIETYVKFAFTQQQSTPDFQIDLNGNINWLNTTIPLTGGTNIYGVTYVDNDNVIMKF